MSLLQSARIAGRSLRPFDSLLQTSARRQLHTSLARQLRPLRSTRLRLPKSAPLRTYSSSSASPPTESITQIVQDVDWSTSFYGAGTSSFTPEQTAILQKPLSPTEDIEIKPDGILYLPEIKYRKILLTAFGVGGWALVPRGEAIVGNKVVTREYALIVNGRFISQAQGENTFFDNDHIPRAVEGCKSNALMRCCKDLGIAAELWDRNYVQEFKRTHAQDIWVQHVVSKKRQKIWLKRGAKLDYPFVVAPSVAPGAPTAGAGAKTGGYTNGARSAATA